MDAQPHVLLPREREHNELVSTLWVLLPGRSAVQLGITRPPERLFIPFHGAKPTSLSPLALCKAMHAKLFLANLRWRWRTASYLPRMCLLESHCDCGELSEPAF